MTLHKLYITLFLVASLSSFAQEKGNVTGRILDAEDNNLPMPFANAFIKGTDSGSTTDFDGNYTFTSVPGTQTIVLSFIGYETIEIPNTIITAGQTIKLKDIILKASEGVALDEVKIIGTTRKESVQALLGEQKKAVEMKSSIGAAELSEKSISNASGAVAKISGVSKEEGTNNVYVRGLGDRYLNTTLNQLSLPSNDINKKNINLDLFSTDIIQNVSISKSYSPHFYGDFSAGNMNITSKEFTGNSFIDISVNSGFNTNAIGKYFVKSEGTGSFGFYNRYNHNPFAVVLSHGVDPASAGVPINYGISASAGKSFDIGEDSKLSLFFSGSFENDYTFLEGSEIDFSTTTNKRFSSVERYKYSTNTTLMGGIVYRINSDHKVSFNSLFINSSGDEVGYYGTKGNGFNRESRSAVDTERGFYQMNVQYNQDLIFVNQLLGKHTLDEKIKLDWGIGYNNVFSHEPDRKRISIEDYFYALDDDPTTHPVLYTNNSFDNQRYFQKIIDDELNGRINLAYQLSESTRFNVGFNAKTKTRNFENIRYGYKNIDNRLLVDPSNLNSIFNAQNIIDGLIQTDVFRAIAPGNGSGPTNRPGKLENSYEGDQLISGGYTSVEFKIGDSWLFVPGFRAESFEQEIKWDVINLNSNNPGNIKIVEEFYLPSINIKYALNDEQNLRLSASKTVSTPEFKEMAPYVYEGVTERIGGNPDLLGQQQGINYTNVKDVSYSDILNLDVKYEWFAGFGQVFSLAAFTKQIKDPINLVAANDATGTQRYFRTGNKARVYGVELEVRKHLLVDEDEKGKLTTGFNATYMHTKQDLFNSISGTYSTSFDRDSDELQGSSPLILNADISYKASMSDAIKSTFNLAGNYFSDRIYSLGSGQLGNRIEKGFTSLDVVWRNKIGDKLELNLSAKNLLNPNLRIIREISSSEEIVLQNYKKGMNISFQCNYKF